MEAATKGFGAETCFLASLPAIANKLANFLSASPLITLEVVSGRMYIKAPCCALEQSVTPESLDDDYYAHTQNNHIVLLLYIKNYYSTFQCLECFTDILANITAAP